MPLQATSGAASYDAFGGGVVAEPNYIESVFSTYLYTGTGVAQTITNGIDVSTKGGLVWIKARNVAGEPHVLVDSARGATRALRTSGTDAEVNDANRVSAFTTSGFSIGTDGELNGTGNTHASWTFRKQPKFFDVVTWTGNGAATQTISHNLGSAPGCIIAKVTSTTDSWFVYHRASSGTPLQDYLRLNLTNAVGNAGADVWGSTSTTITVDANLNQTTNGATYVAYLFAHDAGGFGLSGTDNVISCGSFTGTGSDVAVTLGYEPQWLLIKRASSGTDNWRLYDSMRGMFVNFDDNVLFPNLSNAELEGVGNVRPTATGFDVAGSFAASGVTYIYIAIRRGPMKVPTSGTSVFTPYQVPASPTTGAITGFVTDAGFIGARSGSDKYYWGSRLTGNNTMNSVNTDAESANTNQIWDRMNGWWNTAINNYMTWGFARAPSFFDVVCYTGTGSARTVTHNLGVVPELMIVKVRNDAQVWQVYSAATGNAARLQLNTNDSAFTASAIWNTTTPTSSVFSVGTNVSVNGSGSTYVAYLFATCAGVSKVGSYTGTATTLQIDCGFTAGARFVLIKKTSGTGSWYVWDSSRGIVSGNDPYLLLNSTAAEVTNTDYIDTYSAGFEISSTAPSEINENGGSFIFLAIA